MRINLGVNDDFMDWAFSPDWKDWGIAKEGQDYGKFLVESWNSRHGDLLTIYEWSVIEDDLSKMIKLYEEQNSHFSIKKNKGK